MVYILNAEFMVERVVSYSKAFKKEAEILKIEPFNVTKSPNRWRYFRYEEE
jgi:hypothetical protein